MGIAVIFLSLICVGLLALIAVGRSRASKDAAAITNLQIENARLNEKIKNAEDFNKTLQTQASAQFKTLAAEIFDARSKTFKDETESRLGELLNPLKTELKDFRKRVDETSNSSTKDMAMLRQQLNSLMDTNQNISKEARELSQALQGNSKVQGDWGEMILEQILEKSGLVEGESYFVQLTRHADGSVITDDAAHRLRPDVVVMLPDNKYIVIDSKVSLKAYVDYVNSDNDDDRNRNGLAHVQSVRNHLKELETKRYQDYVPGAAGNSIDYVLMFIPNEHAYMAAMSLDRNLWMEAYEKRVVIISPAHVISTLRLIAQLWTRDKQTKNALKIAEEGGKLYDKFVGFLQDLQNVDSSLNRARESYDAALQKLKNGRGNLVSKVENLKALGAKTTKTIPDNFRDE